MKNVSAINIMFSDRLKERCKALGYRTESEFQFALNEKYPDTTNSAVHSWWSNVSIPKYDNLLLLCDFLECDIDYLYGRMNESTHDIAFVKSQTGLSEEAIKQLQSAESYTLTQNRLLPYDIKPILATLNLLLTSENGLSLLHNLYDYLHSDLLLMKYKDEAVTEDVTVENIGTNRQYSLSPKEYDSIILAEIQKNLILMKHSEQP